MEDAKIRLQKLYGFLRFPLWAFSVGLALGHLDITRSDGLVDLFMFAAAAVLGFLQPKTFPLSAFILTYCLYSVHVFAIQHGVKQPYVEQNVQTALDCWFYLVPNMFGALLGMLVRLLSRNDKPWGLKG